MRLSLGWCIIDTVHASLVILSSLYTVWPIPINVIAALTGGSIILGAGMSIMLAGIIKFRSLRKISGLDTSGLVTTGIYQWSRNPQFFGWFLALIGISLIGRSGFSFLLTVLAIISSHYYITRIEEPYLERIFGEKISFIQIKNSEILQNTRERMIPRVSILSSLLDNSLTLFYTFFNNQ